MIKLVKDNIQLKKINEFESINQTCDIDQVDYRIQ
jgi:hypothetical protein